jgi:hypothetical protein
MLAVLGNLDFYRIAINSWFPNPEEMKSFSSFADAWEFASNKLREIFYYTDLKDCAIDLNEQCPECGKTPLDFIGCRTQW